MEIKLKNVRVSFPDLNVAKAFKDKPPRFAAEFIMQKGDPQIDAIEKVIMAVATEKWG